MLTYRLAGTTEASGPTTTNATSLRPSKHRQQEQPDPVFAHNGAPRRRRRTADLQLWFYPGRVFTCPRQPTSFAARRFWPRVSLDTV